MDTFDPVGFISLFEIHFGIDDIHSRRIICHDISHFFPIFRLRGILITSDDSSFLKIDGVIRKKNFRYRNSEMGENSLHGSMIRD